MSAAFLAVGAALGPPALVAAVLLRLDSSPRLLRATAVVAATTMFAASLSIVLTVPASDSSASFWFSVSELSRPLVPLPAAVWAITALVTPSARLDRSRIVRMSLATAATTIAFMTQHAGLLVALWLMSNGLYLKALSSREHARAHKVAQSYLHLSSLLLTVGVALETWANGPWRVAGMWLIVGAVLIRKGVFPFHAWIPEVFDSGHLGPALMFSAPQLGSYVALVLLVPDASPLLLRVVATLSLLTAVYGAALALGQSNARRATGYLFVSQSALVLAGLDCTTPESLAGALLLWLSSALAFTGLGRILLALEARRGRLRLDAFHGGYDQVPVLAVSFLILGMACTGFPGTLGFVGQEMLVTGALSRFPTLGLLVVGASCLTGIAVVRMYFSLFCGKPSHGHRLGMLRREALGLGVVATVLIFAGLVPAPLVASRVHASVSLLEKRAELQPKRR